MRTRTNERKKINFNLFTEEKRSIESGEKEKNKCWNKKKSFTFDFNWINLQLFKFDCVSDVRENESVFFYSMKEVLLIEFSNFSSELSEWALTFSQQKKETKHKNNELNLNVKFCGAIMIHSRNCFQCKLNANLIQLNYLNCFWIGSSILFNKKGSEKSNKSKKKYAIRSRIEIGVLVI